MEKVIVDGKSFIRSGRKYFYNSHTRQYLHRYLWEKAYGKIPEGYQIHHKDHNPLNNDLDNLELLKRGEHQKHHGATLTDEERAWRRNNLNENARPVAIEWHKSEAGREWHKAHYKQTKDKLHAPQVFFMCEVCESEFVTTVTARFCSNACKSKWRRQSGVDDITKQCEWCKGEYTANKYKKSAFCSRSCASFKRKSKDSPNLRE